MIFRVGDFCIQEIILNFGHFLVVSGMLIAEKKYIIGSWPAGGRWIEAP